MARPKARYAKLLETGALTADAAQAQAVEQLDALWRRLPAGAARRGGWLSRLARGLGYTPRSKPVKGVYLWGGVGRGKTMLMDLFANSLPPGTGTRRHFHRFMNDVHGELQRLQDQRDPLEEVADQLAARARVLCFDELFVADIADAMILGTLFDALFRRGVTLVATSNIAPEDLYRDGLQRARFLPAIDLIASHTEIVHLDSGVDYRLRLLSRAPVYQTPLGQAAETELAQDFRDLAGESPVGERPMQVNGRRIPVRRRADGVIWFDFTQICDGPRNADDYIEIARCHHTVLISNVPRLDHNAENQARRFVALVDEFYDRGVKLILSAAAPVEQLYRGKRLGFEFQRTVSRLLEMRSREYLASEHRP